MVKAAQILKIPIHTTTQNAARLGSTVSELNDLLPTDAKIYDKTAFSMMIPELSDAIASTSTSSKTTNNTNGTTGISAIIVGIETHICVTQTTLDLLSQGHKVYVLADGVSSCNAAERPVALNRLAREGAVVTSSESLLFELMGDAKCEGFKEVSKLVKETKEETKGAVETFCKL